MKTSKLGHTATVSEKGWVVIPKELRDRLGLAKGTKVVIIEHAGHISMTPVSKDPVRAAAGMFADGPDLTGSLLREREEERLREESEIADDLALAKEGSRKRIRA